MKYIATCCGDVFLRRCTMCDSFKGTCLSIHTYRSLNKSEFANSHELFLLFSKAR